MLIRSFNLIDIKNYEYTTGKNILSYFNDIKFDNILDLISLGNNNCGKEAASIILDNYLKSGKSYVDAVLEIKEALIGKGSNDEDDVDEEDKVDISKYESLTDLYIYFSMQLLSVGLSYQEFWSMNTKEMYKVFNSIAIKMQNETNRELNNYHTLAAMIGGAVWGKLQKEPPRVQMVKDKNTDVEDMDVDDAILVAKLKSLAGKSKKGD
jgi:hypothetical protein